MSDHENQKRFQVECARGDWRVTDQQNGDRFAPFGSWDSSQASAKRAVRIMEESGDPTHFSWEANA